MSEVPLFTPFHIKSKKLRNRIVLSPMCQYKAKEGLISDWHLQHYSRFAFSGLGAAVIEATFDVPLFHDDLHSLRIFILIFF